MGFDGSVGQIQNKPGAEWRPQRELETGQNARCGLCSKTWFPAGIVWTDGTHSAHERCARAANRRAAAAEAI